MYVSQLDQRVSGDEQLESFLLVGFRFRFARLFLDSCGIELRFRSAVAINHLRQSISIGLWSAVSNCWNEQCYSSQLFRWLVCVGLNSDFGAVFKCTLHGCLPVCFRLHYGFDDKWLESVIFALLL